MKAKELRNMKPAEIQDEIYSLLKEQFNLKMQQASGQLTKPHLMHQVRKNIARAKTIQSELQAKNHE